jgi:erythromycin esterase
VNKTLIIFLILISHSIFSQEYLNLDFEYTIQGTEHPEKWITGNLPYKISIDTIEKIHFTKSLKIECNTYKENSFGFSSIEFPSEYVRGKSIEFKGKIKTDNVINGYAGLWLTARNDDGIQAFDNMKQRGITNSTDWTKVSIKLNIDKSVSNITFGSLLTGQGKAWFDNLEIFVDGEKFKDIKPKYLEPSKEELNWLKQHIYPLKTFEPNSNFDDDLEILNQLIGNSSVVALGENTHGSSEIFKMKQRIIKYLAQKKDFDIFSSEANMPDA